MSITVFRHSGSGSIGNLEAALIERGLPFKYRTAYEGDLSEFDASADDLLIFLGGNCGVYQGDLFPFIGEEVRIIKERLEKDLPVLGICFGGQLIARALGSKVFRGDKGMECGWSSLQLTPEGEQSIMAHLGEAKTSMTHFHRDTFELPEGASLLASTKLYRNQAFSYGSKILALQCHPEVNYDILTNWEVNGMSNMAANGDLDLLQVRKDTAQYMDSLIKQADIFMHAWLDQIGMDRADINAKSS